MTFSIAAHCPRTGALGIAIASSSPAVAARCAHIRAGVGVVATQNITDPRLGPRGLDLMVDRPASAALAALRREAAHIDHRQLALVDRNGRGAVFTGAHALGITGALVRDRLAVAGNLLANREVLPAMRAAFLATEAEALADRLIAALLAGAAAGGEAGPLRSAGLLLATDMPWPVADLRIDWQEGPVAALASLWEVWRPQMAAYVTRALDPENAPGFGVAGETTSGV